MSNPIPLAYTFGNHMHWVDMQWLWGYDVLPGSIDDMLSYCRATGVKGNINFDGIGYEKLASESPEHIAKLREAIADGTIEVVGGSYGQPYGLFHGGESNIRQRVYGVRTVMRVLGCRPKTFWEEEFDAYPQLPQMLAGCGFTGASLYFQWTWHTPEVPMEEAPVVLWEGIDGTQIPTATRNRMNLHQWPEDFQILLDDLAANPPSAEDGIPPLVLQWLELMPTQDWMCRSELMIPMLTKLKEDPRFEILAVTLGEYLAKWKGKDLPVRKYQPDDFWHGMTLGKNGDNHPKRSAELEHRILEAETASAILGLFGRPYEPWDVYPTWELEECWRNLLAAQHHDNHECEGLCGHIAEAQFEFIGSLLSVNDPVDRLARRAGATDEKVMTYDFRRLGYALSSPANSEHIWKITDDVAIFESEQFLVRIDISTGTIIELSNDEGTFSNLHLTFSYGAGGKQYKASNRNPNYKVYKGEAILEILLGTSTPACLRFVARPETGELEIYMTVEGLGLHGKTLDPGYAGSMRMRVPSFSLGDVIRTDSPYAVQMVGKGASGKRKYPEADWMTSPQWFEEVEGAFTSQTFVDVTQTDGSGILISHSGSQQWFLTESGIENVVLSFDPWDGDNRSLSGATSYRLFPHNGITNAACIRRSSGLHKNHPRYRDRSEPPNFGSVPLADLPPLPTDFSAVTVHSPNVLATAFYREQESFCKRGLTTYACEGMGHPYVLRLVEYDGINADVEVTLPGPIAKAYKTNMMGEVIQELSVRADKNSYLTTETEKLEPFGIEAARITVPMRAQEIATIYLDIIPGRKQFRDLDAKREIWATVHRVED